MTGREWTLVEPCCGSAAVTLHLLGARAALVPYQGSKWSLRRKIEALAAGLGFKGPPSAIVLHDACLLWPRAVRDVLSRREELLTHLEPLVSRGQADPAATYAELTGSPVPSDEVEASAVLLWLQRMSFSGKAVGGDRRWVTWGLNRTSAYGVPATDRFGEVRPLGQALVRAVRNSPEFRAVEVASSPRPVATPFRPLVYLDPPYEHSTGYPCGDLSRPAVVEVASGWSAAGAHVLVSEGRPLMELVELGGKGRMIRCSHGADATQQRFRRATRGEEWVTHLPASGVARPS